MTQQFGGMGMADPNQMQPQAPRPVPLNQLYPTDLLTQPFNVAELDYPPPPIVLPPGVCTEKLGLWALVAPEIANLDF